MAARQRMGWLDLLRGLGDALLDLLASELEALRVDLTASGRRLLIALALLAAGGGLVLWMLGMLALAAAQLLTLWLAPWKASLVVAAVLALCAAGAAGAGWSLLRRVEAPGRTVRRRLQDHLDWWRRRLLAKEAEGTEAPPAGPQE